MELGEEAKGWPQFTEDKGRLIRRAKDPPGVVFFEPRKEDLRYRQLRNMQTGREWSDKKQNAKNMSDKEPSNEDHALATPVATTQPGVATMNKTNDSTVTMLLLLVLVRIRVLAMVTLPLWKLMGLRGLKKSLVTYSTMSRKPHETNEIAICSIVGERGWCPLLTLLFFYVICLFQLFFFFLCVRPLYICVCCWCCVHFGRMEEGGGKRKKGNGACCLG
ncbi:hypothetical protein C4B63_45g124 [Trypanosoma cruzi]|uniref:Uncharacterized protein n=1 Tax=Trypanosoma cruzi TaxID=5693 RepID=A0A2V2V7U8_TRYCR|nr:hypothetical protein C4B63_45g124 [Trypanosoma cruzi]